MVKTLKDILNGVKSSKKGSMSLDGYEPKAGDEVKFAAKHEVEKHDDRVGNKSNADAKDHYSSNMKNYGHKRGDDKKVYEAKKAEDAQCNHSAKGVACPVHGMAECYDMKTIKELNDKIGGTLDRYKDAQAAVKSDISRGLLYPKNKIKNREAGAAMLARRTRKEEVELDEILTKSTTAGETIKDFQKSDAPQFKGKSKEKRKQMALAAYYSKQRNESAVGYGYTDHDNKPRGVSDEAAEMVKSELKALANKAMHLAMAMPEGMHVEPWVQAKIAQAKSFVSDVHDYMIFGNHKEEEDESDTPMTFPGMNVDHAGMNV